MEGKNVTAEAESKEEEIMRALFGAEIGSLTEDAFDSSREHQIFMEVFYGTCVNDGIGNSGAATFADDLDNSIAGATDLQLEDINSCRKLFTWNSVSSTVTSNSSMKTPFMDAQANFAEICGSSSSWSGMDADGVSAKRAKLSPFEWLDKGLLHGLRDSGKEVACLESSEIVSDGALSDTFSASQQVPCRIVESFRQGILSSYYLFDPQGDINGNCDLNDSLILQNDCMNQHVEGGKKALGAKSVTSPVSQESFASALVMAGVPAPLEEAQGVLVCVNHGAMEHGIFDLDAIDITEKRAFIRDLPSRLHSHAHNLLMDAGWKIEPRKRCDRAKLASVFLAPDDRRLYKSLSQAWKVCGKKVLAESLKSEQGEIGREWSDIERFWVDLTHTLAYIEKEIQHSESSLSLSDRWLLLDPFMAVVWIDRKMTVLREGRPLKAANSTACLLDGERNINCKEKGKRRSKDHLAKTNECALGSMNHSNLPDNVSDSKLEFAEGCSNQKVFALRGFHDLQRKSGCEAGDSSLFCSEDLHERSQCLVGCIGKGFHDARCLHGLKNKMLTNLHRGENRASCKSNSIQEGSSLSYPEGHSSVDLLPTNCIDTAHEPSETAHSSKLLNCTVRKRELPSDPSNQLVKETTACEETDLGMTDTLFQHEILCSRLSDGLMKDPAACKITSMQKTLNISVKKTRKKSKRISEIEATEIEGKEMKAEHPHQNCEEVYGFAGGDRTTDHLDIPFDGNGACIVNRALTCEGLEQNEFLEEYSYHVLHAPIMETVDSSALPEVCSTIKVQKKSRKLGNKSARGFGKCTNDNLPLTQNDESGTTSLIMDKVQDGTERLKLTKGESSAKVSTSKKSLSVGSYRRRKQFKSRKANHHAMDSAESVPLTDDGMVSDGPHGVENADEVLASDIDGPLDTPNSEKAAKKKKSEALKENGRKRLCARKINDDDLLIAAIIKNKDLCSGIRHSSLKLGVSKSKALRKLKSKKGNCKLLLRTSGKGGKHSLDSRRLVLGARTVLCWLIEMGVISLKDVLQCRNPKNNDVVKDGWITVNGILCNCCTQIFSVTDFKVHAGLKLQKTSLSLFLQSGRPYTLCQLQAWCAEYKARKGGSRVMEVEEVDQNDDTCGLCGDGGELICCDNCPSTYHQTCLSEQELPEGSWYCPNCICSTCRDVVKTNEGSNFLNMLQCLQCEHKYHGYCIKENAVSNVEVSSQMWFCGVNCEEVYLGLRSRVGVVNCIEDGFSWGILRCSHGDQKVHSTQKIALIAECNSKLAIALNLMEECFLPMVDPRTGIDMIPHVLYNWGSNFARLNYQGFYTVILEKNDELISVASIRVHGVRVAEMPLIATCSKYRRQGMCRRLMNAVEEMLKYFKVEMLVLSAIPSLVDTWTSGFGFRPIGDDDRKQLSDINLMLFPGTALLKKNLYEPMAKESGWKNEVSSEEDHYQKSGLCDERANMGTRIHASESTTINHEGEPVVPIVTQPYVEQVANQHTYQVSSPCRIPVSTTNREHANVNMTVSCILSKGTSDGSEFNQSLSTDEAVVFQVSAADDRSDGCSYSSSFPPLAAKVEPLSETCPNIAESVAQDTEVKMLQHISVLAENENASAMNKGDKRSCTHCNEVDDCKAVSEVSEENRDSCLPEGWAEKGPSPAASTMSNIKLEELVALGVSLDVSIPSKDDICGSNRLVSQEYITEKFQALSFCSAHRD